MNQVIRATVIAAPAPAPADGRWRPASKRPMRGQETREELHPHRALYSRRILWSRFGMFGRMFVCSAGEGRG